MGTYTGNVCALNVENLVHESVQLINGVVVGQRESVSTRIAIRVVAVKAALAVERLRDVTDEVDQKAERV
jgi:hypothetical protein